MYIASFYLVGTTVYHGSSESIHDLPQNQSHAAVEERIFQGRYSELTGFSNVQQLIIEPLHLFW